MRYRSTILILLFIIFLSLPQITVAKDKVAFSWGFFLKTADGLVKSLDFAEQEPVTGGDLLRVYLQLYESSYVYLYLYDSQGDLYQVFPPSPDFYEHSFPAWQKYYIPSSREWFTLDESKGVEKFFILASNERLTDIEKLAKAVIFDRNSELEIKQAAEIIEKKVRTLSLSKPASIDSVQVAYGTKLGPLNLNDGVTANRTTVSAPYGMVLELINQ